MRYPGIASLLTCLSLSLISASAWPASADDVLNIQLPSVHGKLVSSHSGSSAGDESAVASRHVAHRGRTGSAALASRGRQESGSSVGLAGAARERVVGRLGLVERDASIHSSRSSRHSLVHVTAGTYVALTDEEGDWYGVLMADRSTGWMRVADVKILDYHVVQNGPDPAPPTGYAPDIASSLPEGTLRTVLEMARSFLGVPYRYGGDSRTSGIDCSSFVQQCFGAAGISLPRTAHEQATVGSPVAREQLQTGDRIYFADRSGHITHTGIYYGNDLFIHASSRQKGVAISSLSDPMYVRMYNCARRF